MARKKITETKQAPSKGSSKTELQKVIDSAVKKYGSGVLVKGSGIRQPNRIPTGVFTLDMATLGGIPFNRCTMISGAKHAGKSTLATRISGIMQKIYTEDTPVWVDLEGTFDEVWAAKLGVDTDKLLVAQPETGEIASDVIVSLIESLEVSLIVIDSVAALVPYKEYEGSAEDQNVGLQARLIANLIRKMVPSLIHERLRGHNVTVIFLNQHRAKIGGFAKFGGEPIQLPGGKSLGHATSLELELKNYEVVGKASTDGASLVTHNEHEFTVKKNKLNNGERKGAFILVRDESESGLPEGEVDDVETMITYAKNQGIYTGTGGATKVLDLDGNKISAARDMDIVRILNEDPELYWMARTILIRNAAQRKGMPPDFLEHLEEQKYLQVVRYG